MADNKTVSAKVEALADVEILHPIAHDGVLFGRGVHKLAPELARAFLSFRDPVSRDAIARTPTPAPVIAGATKPEQKA